MNVFACDKLQLWEFEMREEFSSLEAFSMSTKSLFLLNASWTVVRIMFVICLNWIIGLSMMIVMLQRGMKWDKWMKIVHLKALHDPNWRIIQLLPGLDVAPDEATEDNWDNRKKIAFNAAGDWEICRKMHRN
jgi:hypothetical protein